MDRPINPRVPRGARRMIHHSTVWMTSRAEALKSRKGFALDPVRRAASPTTSATTALCRAAKLTEPEEETPRPRKFWGTRPVRKSSHDPVREGSKPSSAVTEVLWPGLKTKPRAIPTATDASAVTPNHSSVWPARRAALVTLPRVAIEATIAVKISGGTMVRRRVTKIEPMVERAVVSQLAASLPSGSRAGPIHRARPPRRRPKTRPRMIWVPKDGRRVRRAEDVDMKNP